MSFMTLWSEVATAQQAAASVKRYLVNPEEFWTPWPVATYAKTEPKFSQFKLKGDYGACNFRGSVWIPYNYLIMHGLRKYGFHDAAQQLADKTYAMWTMTDERREWFNSETGEGYGNHPVAAPARRHSQRHAGGPWHGRESTGCCQHHTRRP